MPRPPPRRPAPALSCPPRHAPPRSSSSLPRRLIRDFERDAKADNMPIDELNYRKKQLVQELNSFIGLKKAYGAQLSARGELVGASSLQRGPTQEELDGERRSVLFLRFLLCVP